jgi:hypothetical protein
MNRYVLVSRGGLVELVVFTIVATTAALVLILALTS